MDALFSLMWGTIGTIFIFAGKDFLKVCACFLLCGIFLGVTEIRMLRKELGNLDCNWKIARLSKDQLDNILHDLAKEDNDD